jgi:hypothetical protein
MSDTMHEAVRVRDFSVLLRNYEYQLDASDLGLPPGQWPRALVANQMLWQLQGLTVNLDQEVMFAEYKAEGYLGEYRLTVVND